MKRSTTGLLGVCLCAALLLGGCAVPAEQMNPEQIHIEGTANEEMTLVAEYENSRVPLDENGLEYVDENGHEITVPLYDYWLQKSRREMIEEHSYLRLAFLGHVWEGQSLEEVLERAAGWPSFEICKEMDEEKIYYDDCDRSDCDAFLIIPEYESYVVLSPYTIADIPKQPFWYESDDPKAIIFLTRADRMDPRSQLMITTREGDQATIPLCFDVTTQKINTDCLMGVRDLTPYEEFDSTEIPFYLQGLFDAMYYLPEIQRDIDRGKDFELLWETTIDGKRWAVFGIGDKPTDSDKTDYFVAVRFDEDGNPQVKKAVEMTGPWKDLN